MIRSTSAGERKWVWFFAWMGTGVGYAIGLLGAFTVGPFVVIVSVTATILLGTRRDAREGLAGLVSGFGVPLFYVAYLNRSGPGNVCTTFGAGGLRCVEESSPWPWLVIGLILLAGGCAWFARRAPSDAGTVRS